jgi:hypothetical protein
MCSIVADDRAHPQAAQFNTVRLKVERGKQGMELPPRDNVEILGPVTYASNKNFHFRSEETALNCPEEASYVCEPGRQYHMRIVARADNARALLRRRPE